MRFGLNPTYAGFDYADTPGADNEPISNHGMFVTVTATFTGPIPVVPEPTTMLLLGSGLIGFAGFRRKFKKG